jgi:tetratricopeptide (TPR) repeat protein
VAEPPAPPDESEELLTAAEREVELWKQQSDVMYRRHFTIAKRYRDALELEAALREVDQALRFRPTSEEAQALRAELRRMLGHRAGEVRTLLDDAWEAQRVKRQERKVTVRRQLAEAQRAAEVGDYDRARRAYESVLFIVRTSKGETGVFDDELAGLGRAETTRPPRKPHNLGLQVVPRPPFSSHPSRRSDTLETPSLATRRRLCEAVPRTKVRAGARPRSHARASFGAPFSRRFPSLGWIS